MRRIFEQRWSGGAISGANNYQWMHSCQRMGPDQHPLGLAFYDPPTHIDD
jgi:hypothetical protein